MGSYSTTSSDFYSPPLLIQQLRRSAVCSGMVHLVCVMSKNNAHNWEVTLQCRNKWLFVSFVSLQREHQEAIWKPLLCSFSWVRQALLATNHVKHLTLTGTLFFQIFPQGPLILPGRTCTFLLYNLLTENFPSLLCLHLIESSSKFVPLKSFRSCTRPAALPISQSFKSSKAQIPSLEWPYLINPCIWVGTENKQIRKGSH